MSKASERAKERMQRLRSTKETARTDVDGDLARTARTPAIVRALCDLEKREKLRRISDLLKGKETTTWTGSKFESVSQARCVTYGIGGPDMERVSELLDCTEGVRSLFAKGSIVRLTYP